MKSWQFRAGVRAGFGEDKYSHEMYVTYKAYRIGYEWARKQK